MTAAADPHLLAAPRAGLEHERGRIPAMVEQAKEYIRAGDIFQVVLSQRFSAPFALPAFSLYRALRRVNPSPFLCYLDFGGSRSSAPVPKFWCASAMAR